MGTGNETIDRAGGHYTIINRRQPGRRQPCRVGPTVEELAPPLTALPAEPNEALRRSPGLALR